MSSKFFFFLWIILFIGCINSRKSKFIHPSDVLIDQSELSFSLTDDSELQAEEMEPQGDLITSIGNDNIESNDFLYFTNNATVDQNQNIFIPFSKLNQIKVFNSKGDFLFAFGREGRGPGEFINLGKLAFNRDKNLLIVADQREFEIFEVRSDTVEYLKTIITDVESVSDLCSFGNYFYSNGFSIIETEEKSSSRNIRSSKPLHKFDLDNGEKVLDFGDLAITSESNYGIFDGVMSEMLLSCDPINELIISINRYYPFLYSYSSKNGEKSWEMVIKDFSGIKFQEKTSSPFSLNKVYPKDFHDYYDDIISNYNGTTLLQLVSGIPGSMSLQVPDEFLEKGFFWNNIYIDNLSGEVLVTKKYRNQVLYRNETMELSISPIEDFGSSLSIELRELN